MINPPALNRAALLACVATTLIAPAASAQDLSALQTRMEALEARLQAQAAQIEAQAAEIAALKTGQAQSPLATAPAAASPAGPVVAEVRRTSDTAPPPAPAEAPAIATLPNGRPTFVSADGRFDASLFAIVQVDGGAYLQKRAGPITTDFRRDAAGGADHARDLNSGAALRRARMGIEGRLFDDFDYNFTLELSGEDGARLNQGWVQYTGLRPFRIRLGAFGPNDELEGVTPKSAMGMLEASAVSDSIRAMAGGDGRFAAQIYGFGQRWFASASLSSGSVASSGDYYDDQLGAVGRIAGRPLLWKDGFVHLGAGLSYSIEPPDSAGAGKPGGKSLQFRARPEARLDNARLVGTGAIAADHGYVAGLEAVIQHRNVSVSGEYLSFGVERPDAVALPDPHFNGWYVSGSWILTGEHRRYNLGNASVAEPSVRHPFDPNNGGWGALELAARYSVIDYNFHPGAPGTPLPLGGVRGGEQRTLAGSFNWYLNPSVRLMFGLQDVHIARLSPDPVVFSTPVGAQIGQRFQVVTLRSQLAF